MAEGESDEEEDRPQSLLDQHKAKLSKMTKVQLREERRKKEALEATRKEHALKKVGMSLREMLARHCYKIADEIKVH